MGASADAVMLNEARNKAQKASILSVAVMSVIKEHRQDVITGQTLFVVVRAAVGPKQSFLMLVGFLFSYSDAKGDCTLSARCTLTPVYRETSGLVLRVLSES